MAQADIPLNHIRTLNIVDDLFTAVGLLADAPSVPTTSARQLLDCADQLLDLVEGMGGGIWLNRTNAIAMAYTILDHGYIPLYEQTLHQSLALDLLTHHDYLIDLITEWP